MNQYFYLLAPVCLTILSVIAYLIFWRSSDRKLKEPIEMLFISLLFGSFFTWLLLVFFNTCEVKDTLIGSFFFALFMEEFVKSFALINALEFADKKFNEKNDGIIYGIAAALGFVLVENTLYLQNASDFWGTFFGRTVYTATAHMAFTAIFGLYYAEAYLGTLVGKEYEKRRAPIAIFAMLFRAGMTKFNKEDFSIFRAIFGLIVEILQILTLHITIKNLIFRKPFSGYFSGEVLLEGFLLAYYLHLAYDYLLTFQNSYLNTSALLLAVGSFAFIYFQFKALEAREKVSE